MTFLVIDQVKIYCSYGTCDIKLKITPLSLPVANFAVNLDAPAITAGMSISPPNGVVSQFDAAGNLIGQATFANGIPDGPSVSFDAKGRITQKLPFVKGKLQGIVAIHTEGVVTAEMNFKAGVMAGKSKFYDMKGRLAIQTNFVAGVEDGARITFDVETGAVMQEVAIVQGKVQGAAAIDVSFGIQPPSVVIPEVGIGAGFSADADILATINGKGIANVHDHLPNINIRPFCYCTSPANPAVAAATKKAGGALQPQICTPKTHSPWVPGCHSVSLVGHASLSDTSTLHCAYAGIIKVRETEQKKVEVV
jgi:hypothetical protein